MRLSWLDQPASGNTVLSGRHEVPDQPVTVLSELLDQDNAFPKGLYLRNAAGVNWLRGYVCDESCRFPPDALFAFAADAPTTFQGEIHDRESDHCGGSVRLS